MRVSEGIVEGGGVEGILGTLVALRRLSSFIINSLLYIVTYPSRCSMRLLGVCFKKFLSEHVQCPSQL